MPLNNNQPILQNQAPARKVGTGFTNLQRVIGANQNNKLGSSIQQGVGTQVGNAQSGLNTAQSGFNQQLGQAQTGVNKLADTTSGALQDVTKAAGSDDTVNAFKDLREGSYQGPTGLQNADALKNQAYNAQQLANQVNTSGGRQALLQRFASGGSQYGQGQQRLDNLILGQTAGTELRDTRRQANNLVNNAANAQNVAGQQAQALQAQRAALVSNVQGQLKGQGSDLEKSLTDRAAAMGPEAAAKLASMQDRISKGALTPEDMNFLVSEIKKTNPDFNENTTLYNTDLGSLLNAGSGYSASNVATAEDVARKQALAKLAGQDVANFDPSQVGQASPLLSVNDQAGGVIKSAGDAYNTAYAPVQQQVATQNATAQAIKTAKEASDKYYDVNNRMQAAEKQFIQTYQHAHGGVAPDPAAFKNSPGYRVLSKEYNNALKSATDARNATANYINAPAITDTNNWGQLASGAAARLQELTNQAATQQQQSGAFRTLKNLLYNPPNPENLRNENRK